MTDFTHEECLSRQQAAERLADIAYALNAGVTLQLRTAGAQVSVPVTDHVVLKRKSTAHGDHVTVQVELTWSS